MRILTLLLLVLLTSSWAIAAEAQPASRQQAGVGRLNILFIIFDDWNSKHASAYGCSWIKTPNFDRVANEGILFRNAFTSNPKCSPCRASILTGRNSWQTEEAVCHGGIFPKRFAVYPDLLEQAGYSVGLTGKGWGPGDYKVSGRTRNPAGPGFDARQQEPIASGITKDDYAGNFKDFLDQRPKQKPFCFWMGFHEPHRGYELGSGLRLGKKLTDVEVPPFLPDVESVRSDLLDYAVEVEWGDAQIGKALEVLTAAGQLDNTLVIVTSDHGMPFPYVKGQIHEDGFHLPLAMRWGAAIKPGRDVEDFVNVRDLAPTYLELAGLKPHPQMTGQSLAGILRSDKSGFVEGRDVMLAGKERHDLGRPNDWGYPARAIRTRDFLYVHNFHPERWPAGNPETDFGNCDPSPTKEVLKTIQGYFYDLSFGKRPSDELYDLRLDPSGVNNLAQDLVYAKVVDQLRERMLSMLVAEQDPRALGNGAIFDTYKYVGGRTKGYDTWLKEQDEKLKANPPVAPLSPKKKAKKAKAES